MSVTQAQVGGIAAGAVMGLLISTLGAGGSVFIVPVLLFLFEEPLESATGTSLAVVFAAAAVGAIGHARRGTVNLRVVMLFGGASMVGALAGSFMHELAPESARLFLFGVALAIAAYRMLWGPPTGRAPPDPRAVRLVPLGLLLGVFTGFLGVGGGFLIVPALIWGARLQLHQAIGTSLAIIAMASSTAAIGHLSQGHVSPPLLLSVGSGALLGAALGAPLSGRLPEAPLRRVFGVMAALVAVRFFVRAFGV
jgi:uncharacterized membrane protein YfcA